MTRQSTEAATAMLSNDRVGRRWVVAFAIAACACGQNDPRDDDPETATSSATGSIVETESEAPTTGISSSGDPRLDVASSPLGCDFIDLLFVIDNSESMQTYQQALSTEFPHFIEALFEVVPSGVGIHVGVTTTDFDLACDAPEVAQNCQTNASFEEVQAHYVPPSAGSDGGNGSQGRLFEWAGKRWFETTSDADPADLAAWFGGAAVAAGEDGCSFEMPVAAAGWALDPTNDAVNGGFVRDENALLVVFFLTDEPDKSLESETIHVEQILDAKEGCGGARCVFASGLIPSCTPDVNQKLWQFMRALGDEDPPWGDITDTARYSALVGDALATAVGQACADVAEG